MKKPNTPSSSLDPFRILFSIAGRTLWGYGRFIRRDRVLIHDNNKLLHGQYKSGRLTVFCENSGIEPSDDIPAECNLLHVAVCESLMKASSDFEALLKNRQLSDVTIIAGNEEFHAHKAILAARSPVFSAMFEHEMKEKCENILVVEDVRREIVAEMLHFIYSGRVANLENSVYELLAAADKYALDDLKSMCEEVLFNALTVTNALDLLIFADLHNATKLKARIDAFVIQHSKSIAETKGFKSTISTHPHLIAEVFEKMALQQ